MNRSLTALLLALPVAAGCARDELAGPPDLRPGRDECVACGMLISEDRCSSALLVERNGRREHAVFDDLGCMLDYERENDGGFTVIERFARDYDARAWVPAAHATFLFADADAIQTPMASGIVAFADPAVAEQARARIGGRLMDYAALGEARRAWREARYGRPREAP